MLSMRLCILLIALLLVSRPMNSHANPLAEYQWKYRVIIASMPDGEAQPEAAAALQKHKRGVADRDLLVFDLSPMRTRTAGMKRLSKLQTEELGEQYSIKDEPVFVLIGKDGGVKARQIGSLDLEKFFALIDKMPMRKVEMRKNKE